MENRQNTQTETRDTKKQTQDKRQLTKHKTNNNKIQQTINQQPIEQRTDKRQPYDSVIPITLLDNDYPMTTGYF